MTQWALAPLVQTRIELLVEALGTASATAECLRVSRQRLASWRTGTSAPAPDQLKLLVDLDHVVARLALISASPALDWLTAGDSYLEGARPIDVLHLRGAQLVLSALDAAEQRAWGG